MLVHGDSTAALVGGGFAANPTSAQHVRADNAFIIASDRMQVQYRLRFVRRFAPRRGRNVTAGSAPEDEGSFALARRLRHGSWSRDGGAVE